MRGAVVLFLSVLLPVFSSAFSSAALASMPDQQRLQQLARAVVKGFTAGDEQVGHAQQSQADSVDILNVDPFRVLQAGQDGEDQRRGAHKQVNDFQHWKGLVMV